MQSGLDADRRPCFFRRCWYAGTTAETWTWTTWTTSSRCTGTWRRRTRWRPSSSTATSPSPTSSTEISSVSLNKKQCRDTVGAMSPPHHLVWGTKENMTPGGEWRACPPEAMEPMLANLQCQTWSCLFLVEFKSLASDFSFLTKSLQWCQRRRKTAMSF